MKFGDETVGQVDALGLLFKETDFIAMLFDAFREEFPSARWKGVVTHLPFEELRCGWREHLLLATIT